MVADKKVQAVQQLLPTPLYLDPEYVVQFIVGKVGVSDDPVKQYLTNEVLNALIREGERYIEQKLRPFYMTPFQGMDANGNSVPFTELPEETQVELIDMMQSASLIRIYRQVGANWNAINFESSIKNEVYNLNEKLKDIINTKKDGILLYDPLSGLVLRDGGVNYNNVPPAPMFVTQDPNQSLPYASRHINNPKRNLWTRGYPYTGNKNGNGC